MERQHRIRTRKFTSSLISRLKFFGLKKTILSCFCPISMYKAMIIAYFVQLSNQLHKIFGGWGVTCLFGRTDTTNRENHENQSLIVKIRSLNVIKIRRSWKDRSDSHFLSDSPETNGSFSVWHLRNGTPVPSNVCQSGISLHYWKFCLHKPCCCALSCQAHMLQACRKRLRAKKFHWNDITSEWWYGFL